MESGLGLGLGLGAASPGLGPALAGHLRRQAAAEGGRVAAAALARPSERLLQPLEVGEAAALARAR